MKKIFNSFMLILIFTALLFAQDEIEILLVKGDECYNTHDHQGALKSYLDVLQIDSLNYEASWKAARAFVDIGETLTGDTRKEHFQNGEKFARQAVSIDSTNGAGHLYLSIALGRVALDASAKRRIQLSKEIRKHAELAIKYDPNSDSAYHVLGRWHRKIAHLSWIERNFANIFLGGVPKDASDEQAVSHFKKAIELNPNHINHHLELGITYKMMDKKEEALRELQLCLELPVSDSDDPKYKEEARELIADLK
jgi:tetratricopeptide (TPR) repeat protein